MKKFVSLLLALSMVFALCGVTALAAEPGSATATAVVNANPTAEGAVSDPQNIQKDDIFEVVVKLNKLDPQQIISCELILGWNPEVVQLVNVNGLADNNGKPWPAKQLVTGLLPTEDSDGYEAFQAVVTVKDNYLDGSYYLSTDSQYAGIGYPLESDSVDVYVVRFKAIGTGDTGIKVLEKAPNAIPTGAFIGDKNVTAAISVEAVDIVVKGDEPGPVVDKITAIEAPVVSTEATVGDEVKLPATVNATVEGKTEAVELPITWTPASVDTSKAGEVAVKGVVDTTGYEVDANVKTEFEFTVTVKDKEPEPPVEKTITAIEAPVIETEVYEDTMVELPSQVNATVDGETEPLPLDLTWEPAVVDTTAVGETTVKATAAIPEGYVVAEGVETEFNFTVTVKEKEPEPVEKTITAIEKPVVPTTVDQYSTVELPATVVATVDGAEEELEIVWDPAEVDTSAAGNVKVTGTVTIPDGYKLRNSRIDTTFSFTIKVNKVEKPEVVAPADEIPIVVETRDELPTEVEVKLADGSTVTFPVTWSEPDEFGVVTGTIQVDTDKYALAPDFKLEMKATVVDVANTPAVIKVNSVTKAANGGLDVDVEVLYVEDYTGTIEIDETKPVYLVYSVWNGNTPVVHGVAQGGTSISDIKNAAANKFQITGVEGDNVRFSLVQDIDWNKLFTEGAGDDVGTPVAQGRLAEVTE